MRRAEQETIIRWDEEEQLVHLYSASPKVWRQLAKRGFTVREQVCDRTGAPSGRFYEPVPLASFRFGMKRRMTAAQRDGARERLLKVRNPSEPLGVRNQTAET